MKRNTALPALLVCALLAGCGAQTAVTQGLDWPEVQVVDPEVFTLPDGAVVEAIRRYMDDRTVYRLKDGTELIAVVEYCDLDELPEDLEAAIAAWYAPPDVPFDLEPCLLAAYEQYCADPGGFEDCGISLHTSVSAYGESVVYCTTALHQSLGTPLFETQYQTLAFDRETGEVLDGRDLVSSDEVPLCGQEAGLLENYAEEVRLAEETFGGNVTGLDPDSLAVLRAAAVRFWDREDLRFPQFMDEVSLTIAQEQVRRELEGDWTLALRGLEVRELSGTVLHSYGGLTGYCVGEAPMNSSVRGKKVSIQVNGPLQHGERVIELDRPLSWDLPKVEIQGPDHDSELCDGLAASHTTACGVLFGSVVEVSWTLCDRQSGELREQNSRTWVPTETAQCQVLDSYSLTDAAGAVHVDSPYGHSTAAWPRQFDFETQLKQCPHPYLAGDQSALCPECGGA